MAERVVRLILTGDSAGAVRAMRQVDAAAETTRGHLDRMHAAGQQIGSLGRTMTGMSIPLIGLGVASVKTAASFQQSMTLLRTQVGVGEGELSKMRAGVMALAPKVGEGPNALAAALYPIESVGLRGQAALDALKASAMGAQVSGASLADTADAVAGAMKTQMRDVHGAGDAMSIMNGIVAQGKMHLSDLIGAMSTGILPAAKNVGLGFRDVGVALAAMTRQGIPAQAEATKLRLNFQQFASPSGQALKAFKAIGLGQFQLADDMRKHGLIAALVDLKAHLASLPPDQRLLILKTAFGGARGSANVAGLLNALPMMQHIQGPLANAGESQLAKAFGLRQKDVDYRWQQFKANMEVALIKLGNAIMPLVVKYLPKLTSAISDAVKWFTHLSPGLKKFFVWFTAFLAIGGPILIFIGGLVRGVASIASAFRFLGGPLGRLITRFLPGLEGGLGALTGEAGAARLGLLGMLGPIAAVTAAFLALKPSIKSDVHNLAKNITHPQRANGQDLHSMVSGQQMGTGAGYTPGLMGPGAGGGFLQSIPLIGGLFKHAGGPIRHMAWGGPLGGYGGGDRIPAMLEDGEYVLRKEAVRHLGMGALNSINTSGGAAGLGGAGPHEMVVTAPIQLRIGNSRILAQEVVRFAARASAMSGHYVTG